MFTLDDPRFWAFVLGGIPAIVLSRHFGKTPRRIIRRVEQQAAVGSGVCIHKVALISAPLTKGGDRADVGFAGA